MGELNYFKIENNLHETFFSINFFSTATPPSAVNTLLRTSIMSRYQIEALNPQKYDVYIGFDLAGGSSFWTFFGQVLDLEIESQLDNLPPDVPIEEAEELEEKLVVLWVGSDYRHPIRSIAQLEQLLAPYAQITPDMKQQLLDDQERELHQPKTPLSGFVELFVRSQDSANSIQIDEPS